MTVISNAALQTVLDKLGRFAILSTGDAALNSSLNSGMDTASAAVLTGTNAIDTYIASTADLDVMADLLPAAVALDEVHPTPPSRYIFAIPGIAKMFADINSHLKTRAGAASLDAYLKTLNTAAPTLRVHQAISDHLVSMSAINVFIGNDMELARVNVTGATAGTFVDTAAIDKTKYAGAKLVAKNVGALTATTALSVAVKKFDGTTATLTVSISTLTDGAETVLSDATKNFVDVTGITVVSGGTAGNVVKIIAKTDRDISAA